MKNHPILHAFVGLTLLAGCAAPLDDADVDLDDVDELDDADDAAEAADEPVAAARSALFSASLYTLGDLSGRCVDVEGASQNDGASALPWSCHGGYNQVFRPVFHGAGTAEIQAGQVIQLVARHSDKCLDVQYGSSSAGAPIVQWSCHDGDNQRWVLAAKPGVPMYGGYLLQSKKSGLCLRSANGKLVQGACDATAPLWMFEPSDAPAVWVGLHDLTGYGGATAWVGASNAFLAVQYGVDDMASSLSVPFGLTVAVYSKSQFAGTCETITTDVPDLSARLIGNNTISSIRFDATCP